jgi:hypothetical protein
MVNEFLVVLWLFFGCSTRERAMSTFRKTAMVLAVTALASSSVGQAESLGYYGYDGTGFNNFGGPGYSDGAYAPGVPVGYGDNGYVRQAQEGYEPSAQRYGSGFDQPPPHAGFGGPSFGVYDGPVYGVPGYGDPRQGGFAGYGAPQFDAYPYAQNGVQNEAPFSAYSNFNPAQAPYGAPPPGYGNNYSYNQAPQPFYPGFAGQNNWGNGHDMGRWVDGPWNYGGQGFDNYGSGYGPGAMPYGPPPGYTEHNYGQQPANGYGNPEFYSNGYYGQPYAGFGGPANWSNGWYGNPGNSGGGGSWGNTPNGQGNAYEGYNYGPNNGRSNSNGWGFQHGWG